MMSRESMDILQGDGGQYQMSPWKLASLSGLPGLTGKQWRMPTSRF